VSVKSCAKALPAPTAAEMSSASLMRSAHIDAEDPMCRCRPPKQLLQPTVGGFRSKLTCQRRLVVPVLRVEPATTHGVSRQRLDSRA